MEQARRSEGEGGSGPARRGSPRPRWRPGSSARDQLLTQALRALGPPEPSPASEPTTVPSGLPHRLSAFHAAGRLHGRPSTPPRSLPPCQTVPVRSTGRRQGCRASRSSSGSWQCPGAASGNRGPCTRAVPRPTGQAGSRVDRPPRGGMACERRDSSRIGKMVLLTRRRTLPQPLRRPGDPSAGSSSRESPRSQTETRPPG